VDQGGGQVSRRASIGFDRRIDLEWLDAAASRAAIGDSAAEVRKHLWVMLEGVVRGSNSKSARGKTITVLSHIWADVPEVALQLRSRALAELGKVEPSERLALHWAMMLGTYPLFGDVATTVGKVLALQETLSLAQLTKRLVDAWGARSTMVRAAQRIVRSMVQWGVLRDAPSRGSYALTKRLAVGEKASRILVEAALLDSGVNALSVGQVMGLPVLFPFSLQISASDLRRAKQFRVHRQGMNEDVVELAMQHRG
jgi:hypothetical protein